MTQHHSRIHLVYVPANCKLADVMLQHHFKHAYGIMNAFMWAAEKVAQQIEFREEKPADMIADLLKMSVRKPPVLQSLWYAES